MTLRVAFFACGLQTPAARFRVQQFFPAFAAHGVSCRYHYAYGADYHRWNRSVLGAPYKLVTRVRRGLEMVLEVDADVVFIQRTALPQTAVFEKTFAKLNDRLVFDFDDAIYLDGSGRPSRTRERAVRGAISASRRTVVGNRHLEDWAKAPDKTSVIPTVVDDEVYKPAPSNGASSGQVVVGWMGTSSNFDSLRVALPGLRALLRRDPRVVFRIIADREFEDVRGWDRVEQRSWSAERELADLRSFDVGMMPLVDTEMSRGKCGFKLLLYMATGKPVVASSVGANREIVLPGTTGLLAEDSEQGWLDALQALTQDAARRGDMGSAGRARLEQMYSVRAVLPRYLEIFDLVARR